MSTLLDYSKTKPVKSLLPIAAMLLGVLSGPIAFGLIILVDRLRIVGDKGLLAILSSFLGVMGTAFLFAVTVRMRLVMSRRDRVFTNIGIAVPIIWAVIFVIVFIHAVLQIPMG